MRQTGNREPGTEGTWEQIPVVRVQYPAITGRGNSPQEICGKEKYRRRVVGHSPAVGIDRENSAGFGCAVLRPAAGDLRGVEKLCGFRIGEDTEQQAARDAGDEVTVLSGLHHPSDEDLVRGDPCRREPQSKSRPGTRIFLRIDVSPTAGLPPTSVVSFDKQLRAQQDAVSHAGGTVPRRPSHRRS